MIPRGKRNRSLQIVFWDLHINFIIKKKITNNSLKDLASEAVVRSIRQMEDLDRIHFPRLHLLQGLRRKFEDVNGSMDWNIIHTYTLKWRRESTI